MLVFLGAVIGGIIGGTIAKRRGGKRLDIIQYVGIYALIFALGGLLATLVIHRLSI
ncbi:hypothetical protein Q4577_10120 [Marinovum sp. 2_MG-2023]|uniref:hypothetical protein n=1 Tax=Roseobacteraceae TaxID=2854170 RepID=UPI001FD22380|nr:MULTISPECIES: hypothetical protein [Roseobacteraceae]MCJ7873596.1 hypothetical protein [Phaeobacter sp. J2-8]MDO6730376.1 hypothetical protein [Marinovum sp. 2_MG-2023]MDO6778356.1 hypothetical protein [Marinovum sp. 1_MG-2023]